MFMMPEVSGRSAAQIVGISDMTIRRHIYANRLAAQRRGMDKIYWIDLEELRRFAEEYNYRFNEELAKTLARG